MKNTFFSVNKSLFIRSLNARTSDQYRLYRREREKESQP